MLPPLRETLVTTERLVLAPPFRADFAEWADLRERSRTHLEPWEPVWPSDVHSKADWSRRLKAWHSSWRNGRAHVFLIRRQTDNRLIGGVSLTNVRGWPAQAANLGYWIGADHQGNGYMHEAVGTICTWAFQILDLWRIEAGTLPTNKRSQRVLAKVGFEREGYARDYLEIAGKREDHVLFALVRPTMQR
ncbi:acetyltransferase [Hyphomonas adhaerens MHS-3]|uniref:Acetyltransferase n=1 Tax=Hyphomonas adhaerens MHS-3 TaxID=1280949 RepID=A0A069E9R4_9PROT|nr:GNAT family protein [Hyphomonas adhaerens]KCZ86336.1 acetyltransferase [Hyphomonas adhaerens MHS-3]